jgi:DNA-directed RNA polymerase specialized sigma24 family protein
VTDLDVHLPAIAAGHSRAFADWMAQAEIPLRSGLRSFATHVDVEAVLQETLLRVWQVAPKVAPDGRPNSLLRLAHRIARNLAISEVRRTRTIPLPPELMEAGISKIERVEPRPPDPLLRSIIEVCRQKLPAKPAAALTARLGGFGGASDVELAEGLGMRKNTFLQNFARARKFLVQCLRRHGVEIAMELQ